MNPTIKPRLLSVADAATYIGLSERVMWALLSRGELSAIKIGRRRLIDVKDLDLFVECRKASAS